MSRYGASFGLFIALLSSNAFAQEAATKSNPTSDRPADRDLAGKSSEVQCRYLRAVAASHSSVLLSPNLFATGGLVSGTDSPTGATTTRVMPRVIAGLQYSAANVYRGVQTKELAEAECARYAAFSKLQAFSFVYGSGESKAALKAKLTVLEQARPRVEQILQRARAGVVDARITLDELDLTTARVDTLRASIVNTRGLLRSAEGAGTAPTEPLSALLLQRDRTERASEEREAKLRHSQAWDVTVKAGYDHVVGTSSPLPLFGALTVNFNPGYFWQQSADEKAVAARADAARSSLEAATLRAEETARHMREVLRTERERLVDVTALLEELEKRHEVIRQVPGDKAAVSADSLWIAMVSLRAEKAYLQVHSAELAKVLGDSPHVAE